MFKYIADHPLAGVFLAALIVLTVIVWIKAIASGRKRNEEREKIIRKIEEEKALRNEFRHPDETTFAPGKDDLRLISGMCANIQMSLEKEENMTAAFGALSKVKQYVYCVGYVFEDSSKKLSDFFRSNGEPLLSCAKSAVNEVIGGEFAEVFNKEFIMLDDNDETTSVDNARLGEYDKIYADILEKSSAEIYGRFADFIRENKEEFI